jgi:hypothetical protein
MDRWLEAEGLERRGVAGHAGGASDSPARYSGGRSRSPARERDDIPACGWGGHRV